MSSRFEISDTPLQGLKLIWRKPLGDERGYLERMFCSAELAPLLGERQVVQVNHTLTEKVGTVRGMHYQLPPHAETKFVSCILGEVFDVAVDLRQNSPTFLFWYGEVLSPERHNTMVIPEGFAHGFQTLCNGCELLYFHTAPYSPEAERGLNARDPRLDIRWPGEVSVVSERDAAHPMIDWGFDGVAL